MRSQANTWTCYKKNVEFKKPFLLCSDCMIPFTTMHINTDTDTHLYSEFAWSLLNTKYTCRAVDLWKLMELIYGSYILKRIDFLNGLQTNAQTPVVVWVTIEHSPSPKLIRNIVFSKDNEDGAYLPLALYKKNWDILFYLTLFLIKLSTLGMIEKLKKTNKHTHIHARTWLVLSWPWNTVNVWNCLHNKSNSMKLLFLISNKKVETNAVILLFSAVIVAMDVIFNNL